MSRSKNYCFTINNYNFSDMESLFDNDATYLIFGFEKGENGTPHIQGYMHFPTQRQLKSMKKINERAHWEVCRGSIKSNIDYCSKDGEVYEFGEPPSQGKRTDLEEIRECIEKKTPYFEIAQTYFSQWCQYRHAFREYEKLLNDHPENKFVTEFEYCGTYSNCLEQLDKGDAMFMYNYAIHLDEYHEQELGIMPQESPIAQALIHGFEYYIKGRKVNFKKIYLY